MVKKYLLQQDWEEGATVVTELAGKGYSVNEIQNITRNKRHESVNSYIKRISASQKQKISNDLSISLYKQH